MIYFVNMLNGTTIPFVSYIAALMFLDENINAQSILSIKL